MIEVRVVVSDLEERCVAVQRKLRRDRLGRRELSALEHDLEWMLEELEPRWEMLGRSLGPTPDVRLARVALQALEESVEWARLYRKHAPLRERRERIERGLEGARGATNLLERADSLRSLKPASPRGPQIADGEAG